ncbi:unnamed protein product [Closterium sp. NIES-64]|nr:unnamed protein product [Closterium sp. NIES-64]
MSFILSPSLTIASPLHSSPHSPPQGAMCVRETCVRPLLLPLSPGGSTSPLSPPPTSLFPLSLSLPPCSPFHSHTALPFTLTLLSLSLPPCSPFHSHTALPFTPTLLSLSLPHCSHFHSHTTLPFTPTLLSLSLPHCSPFHSHTALPFTPTLLPPILQAPSLTAPTSSLAVAGLVFSYGGLHVTTADSTGGLRVLEGAGACIGPLLIPPPSHPPPSSSAMSSNSQMRMGGAELASQYCPGGGLTCCQPLGDQSILAGR